MRQKTTFTLDNKWAVMWKMPQSEKAGLFYGDVISHMSEVWGSDTTCFTFKWLLAKSSTTSVLNWSWFLFRKLWTLKKKEYYLNIVRCCLTNWLLCAWYLIGDRSSIVVNSEDWQWVFGLGIAGAVPMVVVALLKEGVVSGLKKHKGATRHLVTCRTK